MESTDLPTGTPYRRVEAWTFIAIFAALLTVFMATARTQLPMSTDPLTNALTSWSIADRGTPILYGYEEFATAEQRGNVAWIVPSRRGPVSQYPPGAALWGALFYVLDGPTPAPEFDLGGARLPGSLIRVPLPSLVPAAVAAAVSAAAAVTLLAMLISDLGASRRQTIGFVLLAGLGSSIWTVAADTLWQHGPAAMWIALGVLSAHRERPFVAGMAFALSILTRPLTGVIPLCIAIAWLRRGRRRDAVLFSLVVAAGVGGLLAYNTWLFGRPSLSGGYGSGFTDRALSLGLSAWVENLARAAFSPRFGFFVYSPFLLVLVLGVGAAWRRSPPAIRSAAVGGVLYLLLTYRAGRASGGDFYWWYRYPIEGLTAMAGLLFLAYRFGGFHEGLRAWLLRSAGASAIVAHALVALP